MSTPLAKPVSLGASADFMKPTSKQILDRLTLALKGSGDAIPEGFKSSLEWQKEWKCCKAKANTLLVNATAQGLMESKKFKVQRTQGITPIIHYRYILQKRDRK